MTKVINLEYLIFKLLKALWIYAPMIQYLNTKFIILELTDNSVITIEQIKMSFIDKKGWKYSSPLSTLV